MVLYLLLTKRFCQVFVELLGNTLSLQIEPWFRMFLN